MGEYIGNLKLSHNIGVVNDLKLYTEYFSVLSEYLQDRPSGLYDNQWDKMYVVRKGIMMVIRLCGGLEVYNYHQLEVNYRWWSCIRSQTKEI